VGLVEKKEMIQSFFENELMAFHSSGCGSLRLADAEGPIKNILRVVTLTL
jgi:hypothetical protein